MLDSAATTGLPIYPVGNFVFIPLLVLAHGLLKGEVDAFGSFVKGSLLHALSSAVLALIVAATLVLVARATTAAHAIVGAAAAACVVMATIEPLRQLAQAGIDRLLTADRIDQSTAIRALLSAASRPSTWTISRSRRKGS
jgi:hypothetical protein